MTVYRIRFLGPATLAMHVATALADADGVDLIASAPPSVRDADTVQLDFSVEGASAAVSAALSSIRADLPRGASIDIADD